MSLKSVLQTVYPHRLPSLQVKWMMYQVFSGLECKDFFLLNILALSQFNVKFILVLHEMEIAHTDIKPENVLLREDDFVSLIEMSTNAHFVKKVCNIKLTLILILR